MPSVYDFSARTIDGEDQALAEFRGKVLLIVNVASRCGFTPQYRGLEALYRKYEKDGLKILGFPCNQFGAQEPAPDDQIMEFCSTHYDVTFPMFAKVDVNGDDAHPLYKHLKSQKTGIGGTKSVKWNFTKFLVDRAGEVVARFPPQASPASIEADVKKLL